jgi:hypothetical protein
MLSTRASRRNPIIDLTEISIDSPSIIVIDTETDLDDDEIKSLKVPSLFSKQAFTLGVTIGTFDGTNASLTSMFEDVASINSINYSTQDEVSTLTSPKLSCRFKFHFDLLQTTCNEPFTTLNRHTKIHLRWPTPIPICPLDADTVSSSDSIFPSGTVYAYAANVGLLSKIQPDHQAFENILIDSGASAHMAPTKANLTNLQPDDVRVTLADGSRVDSTQRGILNIIVFDNSQTSLTYFV